MKSMIEIETQDVHDLIRLEEIISGYLDKRGVKYNVIIGHSKLTIVKSGGR